MCMKDTTQFSLKLSPSQARWNSNGFSWLKLMLLTCLLAPVDILDSLLWLVNHFRIIIITTKELENWSINIDTSTTKAFNPFWSYDKWNLLYIIGSIVHWMIGEYKQLDFFAQWFKQLSYLVLTHFFWTRAIRRRRLTYFCLIPGLLLGLVYSTVLVVVFGVIQRIDDHAAPCLGKWLHTQYWRLQKLFSV